MTPPLKPSENTKFHVVAPEWCTGCLVEHCRRHCAEYAESGEAPCSGKNYEEAMMAAIDEAHDKALDELMAGSEEEP